ncbi:hypothetical protein AQF52_7821 [Streptomyces venezuelae]|nr:hypothetical protein AQF52_7821 [Streptomyces venezuelae]CUM35879.1 hypothetical protein BN2537_723 [Streptomyces venezuelae]
MDARLIAALNDEELEKLFVDNAHPPVRDPEIWAALTHPDNIHRTRGIAAGVHQRTAHVLRNRKAEREQFQQECHARGAVGKREWFETRAEYEDWKRRAGNFHQTVQRAISELTRMVRDANRAQGDRGVGAQRETLRKLALAVQRHQAAHAKAGGIAEQADYELWRMLDTLGVPVGEDQALVPLRTMLDIYWTDVAPVTDSEAGRAEAERSMRTAPAGQSGRYAGAPAARHVHNTKDLA